jgi:hypothetical protein
MPIRAAWMHKRLAFRVILQRCGSPRPRRDSWLGLPYPLDLARLRGQAPMSIADHPRASAYQGLAFRLVLVRSAYACSAIYHQFFVP